MAGSLLAVLNPAMQLAKARDAQRKSDLRQIQNALEIYYNDNGYYPDTLAFGTSWGEYLSKVPNDPSYPAKTYAYNGGLSGQAYYLYASLDRGEDDPQACSGGAACPTAPSGACGLGVICSYGVSSSNVSVTELIGPTSPPSSVTPTSALTSTPVPSAPLIADWQMDEGSGTLLNDATANNNNGTATGASWVAGIVGAAVDFNGTGYAAVSNSSSLQDITTGITIEAWIKPDTFAENYVVSKFNGDNVTSGYNLLLTSTQIYFRLGDGSAKHELAGAHGLSLDTWYHIAATYDGSNMRIYRNGSQILVSPQTFTIGTNTNSLTLGARAAGLYPFDGAIDKMRIYNRALSAAEVLAEYNAGIGSAWTYRFQLTLDRTKVSSTLTDFPVLIHLSASSGINSADVTDVFTKLGSNSKKIAVKTSGGTELPVEIAKWDSVNKQAYLWVKVPSVSSSADTVLYFYYDPAHADNTAYVGDVGSVPAQSVWDANFVSVWHLSQSGSGVAGEFKDSTNKNHNGTGGNLVPNLLKTPTRVDGITGYAQSFDGLNDVIVVPDNDDFSINTTTKLTVSAWLSPSVEDFPTSGDEYIRWLGKSGSNNHEWQFVMYNQNVVVHPERPHRISLYSYPSSGGVSSGDCTQGIIPVNSWVYITGTADSVLSGTYEGNTGTGWQFIFRNAAVSSCNAQPWSQYFNPATYANGTAPLTIGQGWYNNSDYFQGRIGEVRVSKVVRSNAWISASFYSELDNLLTFSF